MNYSMNYSIINDLIINFMKDLKQKKLYAEISTFVFPQTWSSTALGYEGLGGSAMTTASTVVLYAPYAKIVRVYFASNKLAYEIAKPNELFFEDMRNHKLVEQSKHAKYLNQD